MAVLDLRTHKYHVLVRGIGGRYVAPGYLVFLRADGTLAAAAFDEDKLELTGPQAALIGGADAGTTVEDFSVSNNGTLVYDVGGAVGGAAELVWVAMDGTVTAADPSWHANFATVALSRDADRLAATVNTPTGREIWIQQPGDRAHTRLALNSTISERPTWAPDGRIVYIAQVGGRLQMFEARADGLGSAEPLSHEARSLSTGFISPDGRWRVMRTDATQAGSGDIVAARSGDSVSTPLVATPAQERQPTLSPNSRWLAYVSNADGTFQIFVRPFPNVSDGLVQVSVNGGSDPVWSPDGKVLYYVSGTGEMVAASVQPTPSFVVRDRRQLFQLPSGIRRSVSVVAHDMSRDGRRFLMIRDLASAEGRGTGGHMILVENWVAELKQRVPR